MSIKRIAILQARMTSTRLPGKVLMDIAGKPMLVQQLNRLEQCNQIDEIVIATTINNSDDAIDTLAKKIGVRCFRGSEMDVLSRFVGAARETKADLIVRLTADCPLIDPEITGNVINILENQARNCDYASNIEERTYPRGLDVESMFADTLYRLDRLSKTKSSREHVTTFLRAEHPELFITWSVMDQEDNSDLRWTVDTFEDLVFARAIYEGLNIGQNGIQYREILNYVRHHPELIQINANIETWEPTQQKT